MRNSEQAYAGSRGRNFAMAAYCRLLLAGLILTALAACSSTEPVGRYPVYGTVLRIIDMTADRASLEPCLVSREAELGEGKRFAAIRYRHWASHFVTTAYAEIPAGMTVQPQQTLEITPAKCSKNQLAIILGSVTH